ncbi:MAG: hypothetical protein Q8L55_07425 [Phycisphaerales bacterium]|nr:hypothetical protein [Phycisphaerales bacterium]
MSNGRARFRGVATAVLALACSGSGVRAQLAAHDALTPVIGKLPLTTRLVVVSARPGDVLSGLQGPWKRLGPVASGIGGDTLKSWSMLSRRLGYEPGEAFSALTSGGLALVVAEAKVSVAAGVGAGGVGGVKDVRASVDASWAVLAVVKRDVAARVRERLKAVPHEVIAGQPVLSVEDGRFALVCRALSDAQGSDEVLALTPTEDRAFLESIVASVEAARLGAALPARSGGGRELTLSSTRAFAVGQLRAADVLVLSADEKTAGGGAAVPWERASVVACGVAWRAWSFDAEMIAPNDDNSGEPLRLPAEGSVWFDAWAPGAAVMVVGGGNQALERALRGTGLPLLQKDERLEAVGFYSGFNNNERASVWCGVRTSGGEGTLEMDAAGEALAGVVERGEWLKELAASAELLGSEQPATARAPIASPFAAADPSALRVLPVRIPPSVDLAPAAQGGAAAVPASVAWFQCVPAAAGERGPRWMVWGLEPTQEPDDLRAKQADLKGCLTAVAGGEREWHWRAVVRPPRILQALPGPLAFAAGFTGAGAIGEVRFESWQERGVNSGQRARVVVEWAGGAPRDAAPKP